MRTRPSLPLLESLGTRLVSAQPASAKQVCFSQLRLLQQINLASAKLSIGTAHANYCSIHIILLWSCNNKTQVCVYNHIRLNNAMPIKVAVQQCQCTVSYYNTHVVYCSTHYVVVVYHAYKGCNTYTLSNY